MEVAFQPDVDQERGVYSIDMFDDSRDGIKLQTCACVERIVEYSFSVAPSLIWSYDPE